MTLLAQMKIQDLAQRMPSMVSLGQSKRAAIARAVHTGARVLFLDEPFAGLDLSGIHDILTLIQGLLKSGLAIVVVEHHFHIPRLLPLSSVVWTLRQGKLLEESPTGMLGVGGQESAVCDWLEELSGRQYSCSSTVLSRGAVLHIAKRPQAGRTLFAVDDYCIRRNGVPIVGGDGDSGFSIALEEGDIAIVEAPNGWGKSTVVDALAGIVDIASGTATLANRRLTGSPWERRLNGLSTLRSSGNDFPELMVSEVFQLAGIAVPDMLKPLAHRLMGRLSGGQQQTVKLLQVLSQNTALVRILDEPFNMLDRHTISVVKHLISDAPHACTLVTVPALTTRDTVQDNHKSNGRNAQ